MANRTVGLGGLIGLGLRRIRFDLPVIIILAISVTMTAFAIAAIPRFVTTTSDRALAAAAQTASPQQRNVTFSLISRLLPSSEGPFAAVNNRGDRMASELGEEISSAVSGSDFAVTSPRLEVWPLPTEPRSQLSRWFQFRTQSDIGPQLTLMAGALPEPVEPMKVPVPPCGEPGDDGETECGAQELPVFQTALTQETADALGVGVGDLVDLKPDIRHQLNARLPLSQLDYEMILEISGIVELSDPSLDMWNGDTRLHRPIVISNPVTGSLVFAMGLLADDDYARLIGETAPSRFSYEWRYFLDFDEIDSSNIGKIGDEVEELSLVYESRPGFERSTFRTGVDDMASQLEEQSHLAVSFLSLVFMGLLGVVTAVILVLASLAARRRQESTILVRSRGADAPRLTMARFIETLILFVPAAGLGLGLARLVVSGKDGSHPLINVVLVAVGLAVVFVLASLPILVGDLGVLLTRRTTRSAKVRRMVVEVVIVVLAVGAVVLLRRRGIDPTTSVFDPLLAAAPLLIALAMGIVLLRLAPQAARLATVVGSRAKGVVGMIGFRELAERGLAAQLPWIVITIGVAIGVFGLVQIDTIDHAQVLGSWQAVGANYRAEPNVQGADLSPDLSTDSDGVTATADAAVLDGQVPDNGILRGNLQVLGVDTAEYQAVGEGTPADPMFPESMRVAEDSTSAEVGAIPALISASWPVRLPEVDDVIEVAVDRVPVEIRVADVRRSFPGIDPDRPFVVVDREALGSISDQIDVTATRRYVRAPDSVSAGLQEYVDSQFRGAKLISRPDVLESITGTPTMSAIEVINTIALVLAAVMAVVAAVSGFALTARQRTRDLGYMRAIGLTRRQMAWAIITEQMPPTLLAAILGVVAGIAAAVAIEPSLDVTSLTATTLPTPLVVDWGTITVASLAIVGSVLVATAIYSYSGRDLNLANVLRRDERV